MSAGSGGIAMLVRIEPGADVVDLKTSLAIEQANCRAWQAIAVSRAEIITQLQLSLARHQKRSNS